MARVDIPAMMNAQPIEAPTDAPEKALRRLSRVSRDHADRASLEAVIRRRYWTAHHARRCHFLDHLLALHGPTGKLAAALGIGVPHTGPFFLEAYLDRPVEAALTALGLTAERNRIVEIGNLASQNARASTLLMVLTAAWLEGYGTDWGVVTATSEVRDRLASLGLASVELAEADPARIGPVASEWGRYYEADPRVLAVSFEDARPLIGAAPEALAPLVASAREDGAWVRLVHEGGIR